MLTLRKFDSYPKAKDSRERNTVRHLLSKTAASKTNEMILAWFSRYACIHKDMYIYAFSLLPCPSTVFSCSPTTYAHIPNNFQTKSH